MVVPINFPARFTDFMFAIAEDMETNTMGTTTQNIMLIKTCPMGSSTVAPGHRSPTMVPLTMPAIIRMTNP